jgi:hypothetical protein
VLVDDVLRTVLLTVKKKNRFTCERYKVMFFSFLCLLLAVYFGSFSQLLSQCCVLTWFVSYIVQMIFFMEFFMFGQVLDLMVRMLGFSNEDKQRIGLAQQGPGKGVVRGVLGLPGRLVGGILGGSSTESAVNVGSDNQVISSLVLVYFLLWCTSFVSLRSFT